MTPENIIEDSQLETGSKASNFLSWFNPFSRGVGMYAWLFQRITGLCLLIYVFIHMSIIGLMLLNPFLGFQAGELYNTVVHAMNQNLFDTGIELFLVPDDLLYLTYYEREVKKQQVGPGFYIQRVNYVPKKLDLNNYTMSEFDMETKGVSTVDDVVKYMIE